MKETKLKIAVLLLLPLLGAALGCLAGPTLARMDYIVQVAERVWLEQSTGLEERTLQSEAFYATNTPSANLFEQAREIRVAFRRGTAWFGLWCGLVAALTIVSALSPRRRREFLADPGECLACARCYEACPVEHEHLPEQVE